MERIASGHDDFAWKLLRVESWALFKTLNFKLVNLEFLERLSDSVPVCTPTMSAWMRLRMERARKTEKPCSVVEIMQGCCICPEKKNTFFGPLFSTWICNTERINPVAVAIWKATLCGHWHLHSCFHLHSKVCHFIKQLFRSFLVSCSLCF